MYESLIPTEWAPASSHTQYNYSPAWNISRIPFLRSSMLSRRGLINVSWTATVLWGKQQVDVVYKWGLFYKISSLKIFCLYINGNAKRQHMISKKAFWEIFPAVWRPIAQVWSRGLICKVWQARFLLYNQRSGNISENLICRQICVGLDLKF